MNDIGCGSAAVTRVKEPPAVPVHLSDYLNYHPLQWAVLAFPLLWYES